MDLLFLGIVIFLFLLAVFDLSVGVSNDAVNFLSSAVGSRAASFKRIIIVAAIGVFVGAAMSNGMMDVARHGIFRPENLSFYDVIAIFMAVMVTDVILLDVFNSLGMPTSTTVSLVFELLGATFIVALFKMADPANTLGMGELLNTEKALAVILGIFLSVGIAFVFGTVVQFLARLIFTFEYKSKLKWKVGLFGGIACTAIVYFMLLKGIKDLTIMTPELKTWINSHNALILGCCFIGFTILMQLLYWMKVNVFKVVVLLGTFSLAMAFAGNDLVNFVGVPFTSLAAYQDYMANGGGDLHGFMMNSLNGPAQTPFYFLIGAGGIMVIALSTSRKARQVTQTTVGLSSKQQGDEMFGSSRLGRAVVRGALNVHGWVTDHTPRRVKAWIDRRMNSAITQEEDGAAFDLVRGSVNLMLAAMLIAFGTSLKLPLSTTFVTFMVAMGTSLADRAWGRESAVFRITGVISVIGGWFLTAGAAFIGAGLIVAAMHFGGLWVMILLAAVTIYIIIHSNRRFNKKNDTENSDLLFQTIITTKDKSETWPMLMMYITEQQIGFMSYAEEKFRTITYAFINENAGLLGKTDSNLAKQKTILKNSRRKETLCLRYVPRETAIEKSTWFYLSNNCCMGILYNLRRITEVCKEHVENNFLPLPQSYREEYETIMTSVTTLFNDTLQLMQSGDTAVTGTLRRHCDDIKDLISDTYHRAHDQLRDGDASNVAVLYVYVNMLQETQEMVSSLRKYLRAFAKLLDSDFRSRPAVAARQDVTPLLN